jgi:hypothetical protein
MFLNVRILIKLLNYLFLTFEGFKINDDLTLNSINNILDSIAQNLRESTIESLFDKIVSLLLNIRFNYSTKREV